MEKKFTKFELSTIKRTAQNVNPMVTRKHKLLDKITELQKEYEKLEEAQEQFEAPIRTITGGYTSEELINKVIEDTGKVDKSGNPIKVTKWVFKYPDTIIPTAVGVGCTNSQPMYFDEESMHNNEDSSLEIL